MADDEDLRDYPTLGDAYDLGYNAEYDEGAPSGMEEPEVVAFYQGKEDRMAAGIDAARDRAREPTEE